MAYHGSMLETAMVNENYRQVITTGKYIQLVAMSLKPGEDTGEQTHDGGVAFFFVAGEGNGHIDNDTFEVAAGDDAVITTGSRYRFKAEGSEPLKFLVVYAPPKYEDSLVQKSKSEEKKK
ncbi:cupin domain-containing protein [Patescibacteria group bacterium]